MSRQMKKTHTELSVQQHINGKPAAAGSQATKQHNNNNNNAKTMYTFKCSSTWQKCREFKHLILMISWYRVVLCITLNFDSGADVSNQTGFIPAWIFFVRCVASEWRKENGMQANAMCTRLKRVFRWTELNCARTEWRRTLQKDSCCRDQWGYFCSNAIFILRELRLHRRNFSSQQNFQRNFKWIEN